MPPNDRALHLAEVEKDFVEKVNHHRFTIYDSESDVHTGAHTPKHVEVDVLNVNDE